MIGREASFLGAQGPPSPSIPVIMPAPSNEPLFLFQLLGRFCLFMELDVNEIILCVLICIRILSLDILTVLIIPDVSWCNG